MAWEHEVGVGTTDIIPTLDLDIGVGAGDAARCAVVMVFPSVRRAEKPMSSSSSPPLTTKPFTGPRKLRRNPPCSGEPETESRIAFRSNTNVFPGKTVCVLQDACRWIVAEEGSAHGDRFLGCIREPQEAASMGCAPPPETIGDLVLSCGVRDLGTKPAGIAKAAVGVDVLHFRNNRSIPVPLIFQINGAERRRSLEVKRRDCLVDIDRRHSRRLEGDGGQRVGCSVRQYDHWRNVDRRDFDYVLDRQDRLKRVVDTPEAADELMRLKGVVVSLERDRGGNASLSCWASVIEGQERSMSGSNKPARGLGNRERGRPSKQEKTNVAIASTRPPPRANQGHESGDFASTFEELP